MYQSHIYKRTGLMGEKKSVATIFRFLIVNYKLEVEKIRSMLNNSKTAIKMNTPHLLFYLANKPTDLKYNYKNH